MAEHMAEHRKENYDVQCRKGNGCYHLMCTLDAGPDAGRSMDTCDVDFISPARETFEAAAPQGAILDSISIHAQKSGRILIQAECDRMLSETDMYSMLNAVDGYMKEGFPRQLAAANDEFSAAVGGIPADGTMMEK